jgi:hypothetical protein
MRIPAMRNPVLRFGAMRFRVISWFGIAGAIVSAGCLHGTPTDNRPATCAGTKFCKSHPNGHNVLPVTGRFEPRLIRKPLCRIGYTAQSANLMNARKPINCYYHLSRAINQQN